MENKQTGASIQQVLTDSIQQMANLSLGSMKPLMEGMVSNLSSINKSVQEGGLPAIKIPRLKSQCDNCCPPEPSCPPHCIASIHRCAMQGERIVVPFVVKNTCSHAKTWRIGVRELKNEDGQVAPSQPQLSKQSVTLEPGRSERVLMQIDLGNFTNGAVYTTEIVLREKDVNQNICFTLTMDDCNATVAEPKDEKKYRLRWQGWQSHYYCEPASNRLQTNILSNQG